MGSQDIGDLGPKEGTPVTYHWNLAWNLAKLLPWLVLIYLLQLKPNRNWRAWMVAFPVVLIHALLWPFLYGPSFMFVPGTALLNVLAMGLCVLWLVSYKLESRHGREPFFAAASVMVGMGVVWVICDNGLDVSVDVVAVIVCYTLVVCAVLLAINLARRSCRRRYTAQRFMRWLLLWLVAMSAGLMIPCAIISNALLGFALPDTSGILYALIGGSAFGVVLGVIAYIVLLPFMLLAFRNSLYRARFHSILGFEEPRGEPGEKPLPDSATA